MTLVAQQARVSIVAAYASRVTRRLRHLAVGGAESAGMRDLDSVTVGAEFPGMACRASRTRPPRCSAVRVQPLGLVRQYGRMTIPAACDRMARTAGVEITHAVKPLPVLAMGSGEAALCQPSLLRDIRDMTQFAVATARRHNMAPKALCHVHAPGRALDSGMDAEGMALRAPRTRFMRLRMAHAEPFGGHRPRQDILMATEATPIRYPGGDGGRAGRKAGCNHLDHLHS